MKNHGKEIKALRSRKGYLSHPLFHVVCFQGTKTFLSLQRTCLNRKKEGELAPAFLNIPQYSELLRKTNKHTHKQTNQPDPLKTMVTSPTLEFSCHKLQNKSKKLMHGMPRSCQRGKKNPHTVLGCSS